MPKTNTFQIKNQRPFSQHPLVPSPRMEEGNLGASCCGISPLSVWEGTDDEGAQSVLKPLICKGLCLKVTRFVMKVTCVPRYMDLKIVHDLSHISQESHMAAEEELPQCLRDIRA